jgi:predicted short-subunit dehydrogenase-like oxidoreductase (DUF2520 family)
MANKCINNFSIIGAGMVGTAIGYLLKKNGFHIIRVIDQSPIALKRAKSYLGCATSSHPVDALKKADVILITTPDDTIVSVCTEISKDMCLTGKFVLHMSGAGDLDFLSKARQQGARVACIHPIQSFSSIDQAIKNIPGSYFGITADQEALGAAKRIVRSLKGIPLLIPAQQKPLYHAAACFASNYLVSLMNTVESIYQAIGIKEKNAQKAYLPLVYGSLKNIENSGTVSSLTGPIARGDSGTVKKHVAAIRKTLPQYSALYRIFGLATVKVAQKKGTLKNTEARKIISILKGV